MKTIILSTLVACLLLAWTPVIRGAESTNLPPAEQHLVAGIILVGIALIAGAVVVHLSTKNKQPMGPVDVVLQGSADNVTWENIVTNTVVLNGRDPLEIYREYPRRDGKFYRAKWYPPTGVVTNLFRL